MESNLNLKFYGNGPSSKIDRGNKYFFERYPGSLFREWTFNKASSYTDNRKRTTLEDAISKTRKRQVVQEKQPCSPRKEETRSSATKIKSKDTENPDEQRYVYFVISGDNVTHRQRNETKSKKQQKMLPVCKAKPADAVSLMRQHTMTMVDPISELDLRMEPVSQASWFSSSDERMHSGRLSRGPFPTPVSPVTFSKVKGEFDPDIGLNHSSGKHPFQLPLNTETTKNHVIQRESTNYTLQTLEIPEISPEEKRKALGSPLKHYRDLIVTPSVGRRKHMGSRGSDNIRKIYSRTRSGFFKTENSEMHSDGKLKREMTDQSLGISNRRKLDRLGSPLSLPRIPKVSDYYDELLIETVRSNFEGGIGRSDVLVPTAYAPSIETLSSAKTSRFSTKTARTAPPEITWNSQPSNKFLYDTTYPHQRSSTRGADRTVLKNTYFKMCPPRFDA